jgi:hypothetical protein
VPGFLAAEVLLPAGKLQARLSPQEPHCLGSLNCASTSAPKPVRMYVAWQLQFAPAPGFVARQKTLNLQLMAEDDMLPDSILWSVKAWHEVALKQLMRDDGASTRGNLASPRLAQGPALHLVSQENLRRSLDLSGLHAEATASSTLQIAQQGKFQLLCQVRLIVP